MWLRCEFIAISLHSCGMFVLTARCCCVFCPFGSSALFRLCLFWSAVFFLGCHRHARAATGLQETAGREHASHFRSRQDSHALPPGAGDPTVPHLVSAGPLRVCPLLGQGGEDRRRLCRLLLQSRGPRHLQRLHQQLFASLGRGQARVETQIGLGGFPQGKTTFAKNAHPP